MFFPPFILLYALIFFVGLAFLFTLLEIGVIHYAFGALGLPPEMAYAALLTSLLGSYINIPLAKVAGGEPHAGEFAEFLWMRYPVPARYATGGTTVAINVGGAVVPILISLYWRTHQAAAIIPPAMGVVIVALVGER